MPWGYGTFRGSCWDPVLFHFCNSCSSHGDARGDVFAICPGPFLSSSPLPLEAAVSQPIGSVPGVPERGSPRGPGRCPPGAGRQRALRARGAGPGARRGERGAVGGRPGSRGQSPGLGSPAPGPCGRVKRCSASPKGDFPARLSSWERPGAAPLPGITAGRTEPTQDPPNLKRSMDLPFLQPSRAALHPTAAFTVAFTERKGVVLPKVTRWVFLVVPQLFFTNLAPGTCPGSLQREDLTPDQPRRPVTPQMAAP